MTSQRIKKLLAVGLVAFLTGAGQADTQELWSSHNTFPATMLLDSPITSPGLTITIRYPVLTFDRQTQVLTLFGDEISTLSKEQIILRLKLALDAMVGDK